ncbi:MAG: energy transducer TonB [Sphingomonadaceae bacterium]
MNKVARKIVPLAVAGMMCAAVAPAHATSSAWSRDAIEKVAAHRTTPRSAQLRGSKGTAQMAVSVDGNGMITDYRLVRSSGSPILDREADLILMRVGSFAAPPGRTPRKLTIPIQW